MEVRCRNCGELNPERAKFCLECGAPMTAAAMPASRESRRTVTVVFADMVGFTTLGERLDQESLRRVMDSFYAEMRVAIEAEAGTLAKFIGDAVLAVWGTPEVHEDDAVRAVRAAEGMRRRLDPLNEELERRWDVRIGLRTGVNTGEVVVDPTRPADLLVGDTLNVAARLEQAARDGEILLGPETYPLVRDAATLAPVEPLALKGKAEPMPAWRVIDGTLPDRRAADRMTAPLVGRERELERLRAAWAAAVAARSCRLATIVGSPGLGKTRLAGELAAALGGEATVLVGRCQDTGEGITFQPIAEVLRAAARIEEDDGPEAARALLAGLAPDGDPEAERVVDRAASVLGLAEPGPPAETFWAVRRLLETIAAARPVLLVLDDVHWGQPTFFELVEHLVRWSRDAPILVVATARPELREVRPDLADPAAELTAEVVALEPLGDGDSRALIGGLLGPADLPEAFAARLLEATEGNPLFLGELVRMLADDGVLRRDGDGWRLTGEAGAVAVPPTIQALLGARIERLGDEERTVVEHASVIGHEFSRGAVAELVPPPVEPVLDETLTALGRKELVRPEDALWFDERLFRFGHILVRDAAYRSLLKEARAELHERFAGWLEAKVGELAGEYEEVIAFHLEQADRHRRELGPLDADGRALAARAGTRLASAGQRALRRQDLPAAVNLLERALVPLAPDAPARTDALRALAEASLAGGETARALAAIEELGEAARVRGDERLGAWATVLVAEHDALTGGERLAEVIEAATEAARVLERTGDGPGVAKAWQVVAAAEGQRGRVAAAEAALDRALGAAREAGDEQRETAALAGAPRAALWGPAPVLRAAGRCMDTIRVLRMRPGRRHVEAIALRCQAVLEAMRGRAEASAQILADCRAVYEELGLALELNETAVYAGIAALLADDPKRAEAELRGARDGFAALGADVPAALASAMLARALLDQDRVDEALEATREAEARAGEDLKAAVTWRAARAEALALRGEHEAAREHAERAVALGEPTDALPDKADALMSAARVADARGDAAAATRAAREAARLYEAKGHTVGAARAAAFLDVAAPPAPTGESPAPAVAGRLGETAAGRQVLAFVAAYNARDWERVLELNHPDMASDDHRTLAWEPIVGAAGWIDTLEAFVAASPDSRLEVTRVVGLEDDAAAIVMAGHGTSGDGGAIELVFGQVLAIGDGRTVVLEFFEPEDEAGMLARLAELTGEGVEDRLATTASGRGLLAFCAAYNERDWEAMRASYHEDAVGIDRRALGWREFHGPEGSVATMRSFAEAVPASTIRVARIVAMEETALAVELVGGGTDRGGGETEMRFGHVSVVRDGARVRVEFFDPGDDEGMRARVAELGGDIEARLATTSIGRAYLRYSEANRRGDPDALRAAYTPDFTMRDGRAIGWEEVRGRDAIVGLVATFWADLPERTSGVTRILRMEDELAAVVLDASGVDADGAAAQLRFGQVAVARDGRLAAIEMFEPDDEAGMLARFEELRVRARLSETAVGRAYLRYSEATARGDLDAFREVYAEDIKMRDRRRIGWEDVEGREAMIELLRGFVETTRERSSEVERILELDDEVAAVVMYGSGTAHDGGAAELRFGQVCRTRDDRTVVLEMFEPDDEAGMRARFEELRVEARLATTRVGRNYLTGLEAFRDADWDALREVFAEDIATVDRRQVGWEVRPGADALIELLRGLKSVTPDAAQRVVRIVAMDDDLAALELRGTGTLPDGGQAEINLGQVARLRGGRRDRLEIFEPDDHAGMLARFEELRTGARLEASAAGRTYLAFVEACTERDWERLRTLYTDGVVGVDRRAMAWTELRGPEAFVEIMRSFGAMGERFALVVDRVLAADGDRIALVLGGRGPVETSGGEAEFLVGHVTRVRDGRFDQVAFYEPDDDEAMLAAYAGLGGSEVDAVIERYVGAFNGRDWDALRAVFAPDTVFTDRRAAGWGDRDRDRLIEDARSAVALAPDVRDEVTVLWQGRTRDGGWASGGLERFRGRTPDGADFTLEYGTVSTMRDGVIGLVELMEAEDREAIVARARELAEGAAGHWVARYASAINRRDWEGLRDLFEPDAAIVEHRPVGWGDRDVNRLVEDARSAASMSPDLRHEVTTLWEGVTRDGSWVIAAAERFTGTGTGNGDFAFEMGAVFVGCGPRLHTAESMEPEDRDAIVARARELAGQ